MNMVKKIALFVPWIKSKGGMERTELNILKNSRHKIDVYTFDYEKEKTFSDFEKFNIIRLKNREYRKYSTVMRGIVLGMDILFTKVDLSKYDVLLISTSGIAELFAIRNHAKVNIAFTHTQLRIAHEFYDYYRKKSLLYKILLPPIVFIYKRIEKIAWKHIDYSIVQSEEVKDRFRRHGTFSTERVFKVSPPLDLSGVKISKKTKKFFLYNSRFTDYKRQDLAIEAFKRSGLQKNGFKLVLSGFIEDEKYFKKLKKAANKYIVFKPNISEKELKQLYRDCYATVFLAVNEDTGLVPLESLAYGKPVITVNEGGPKEFITNGYNGFVVNADVNAVADAMIRMADKRIYSSLKYGAEHSTRYTVEAFIKKFDELIDALS